MKCHTSLTALISRFFVATLKRAYEFDPAKDEANQAKHGVSLALAAELDWEAALAALVRFDDRFEYDELRMIALAPKADCLASSCMM